jgi:hypothetical protein
MLQELPENIPERLHHLMRQFHIRDINEPCCGLHSMFKYLGESPHNFVGSSTGAAALDQVRNFYRLHSTNHLIVERTID